MIVNVIQEFWILCNTRILDTMNYTNQVYVHANYTLIFIYSMLLVTGSQSKNVSCFCLDMPGYVF
jgi:hypothetical protein